MLKASGGRKAADAKAKARTLPTLPRLKFSQVINAILAIAIGASAAGLGYAFCMAVS
jgi:hypothetical protein